MDTNELTRLILNLIRKGTILAVDLPKEKCRVQSGDLQTNWINWLALAAGATTDWNPPTVGEQVLLLSPGGDPADAVALRGIYSDAAQAPSHSPNTHTRKYPDGAVIEYDHEAHALTAQFPQGATFLLVAPSAVTIQTAEATIEAKSVTVKADTVLVDAPETTFTGNVTVQKALAYMGGMTGQGGVGGGKAAIIHGSVQATGDLKADGDVTAGEISLLNHTHIEQGDGQAVSKPK